jgi:hypothetical protein
MSVELVERQEQRQEPAVLPMLMVVRVVVHSPRQPRIVPVEREQQDTCDCFMGWVGGLVDL